ncbi:hypothetical protein ACO2Q8_04010 [Larkinella sp. VNQ87]|uniref:hypothetical protein n=1 Tax=Larkinella sp. VNQ87 TaxID=3400921 RepID=UPI003C0C9565
MQLVSKKAVGQWLLLSLLSEQRELLERTRQFQAKYGVDFSDFEKQLQKQEHEIVGQWEDFIEWQSVNTALAEIRTKIKDVEDGAIRVVD